MIRVSGSIVENFTVDEMACHDGTLIFTPASDAHAHRVQKLRWWYRIVTVINSWYRSLAYNRTLPDSSDSSQHILGLATDIAFPPNFYGWTAKRKTQFIKNFMVKWGSLCKADGLGGAFGVYDTFFHIDSRPGKITELTTWDLRKNKNYVLEEVK